MTTMLEIATIRLDGGTQPRAGLDERLVARLVRAMKRGDEFPAVHVFFDGEHHWMADGFHRVKARQESGHADIEAVVEPGTVRDAFLHALSTTGARNLTLGERRVCALRMLRDKEWSRWGDSTIGRHCGISHPTVARLRKASCKFFKMQPSLETPGGIPEPETLPIERKRKAIRGGKEYEISLRQGSQKRPPHLSLKAKSVIKHLPIVKDRKQMGALAALASPTQMLVAQRLKAGESTTVEGAMKAILSGAPVDDWSRAYAAVMKLGEDDRVRMFRWVVERGDMVKVCQELLAKERGSVEA